MERLLAWLCTILGLVLAVLWLITEVMSIALPGWIPPAGLVCVALAAALP